MNPLDGKPQEIWEEYARIKSSTDNEAVPFYPIDPSGLNSIALTSGETEAEVRAILESILPEKQKEQIVALKKRALSKLDYGARIDLKDSYDLLETLGIIDSLARSLLEVKNFKKIKTTNLKGFIAEIFLNAIPKNFLMNYPAAS